MSAMLALRSASTTMLTTAKNAHKHVVAVLKNVEGWLGNLTTLLLFFGFVGITMIDYYL